MATYSAIVEPVFRGDVSGKRPTDISRAFREVAGFIDRSPTEALIRVQADSASVGRFFVQVVDRRNRAAVGPYVVRLWLTTDATGLVPGGVQDVTFVVGSIIDTIAPNERYVVLTNAQGQIELTATTGANQTMRLVATVEPFLHVSDEFTGAMTAIPPPSGTGTNLTWDAPTRTVASDTGSDAVITLFTSTDAGLTPLSGGGTSNFLRADGTWAAPGGGGATNLTWTASTRTVASDTGTDAVITLFTDTDPGLVPLSGGGSTNFLRADGTWAAPSGGGGLTQAQVLARGLGA